MKNKTYSSNNRRLIKNNVRNYVRYLKKEWSKDEYLAPIMPYFNMRMIKWRPRDCFLFEIYDTRKPKTPYNSDFYRYGWVRYSGSIFTYHEILRAANDVLGAMINERNSQK